ncbi:hypothetical protein FVEN_g11640 [Fusarium venenatum]|uniref:Uncharacterized protein n=1 Tax=Fusarium venenatum TaxID=56646 RepID=A0A2L2TTI2_9HYPO|nr:uncharacterized protein FVRRES_01102 [Fusarium venenatum]KAG8350176.1 hypothetical protein FVEN_g11640 [Fusarium venenatum]CEI64590.1 unnamed protein product [Fusarium venenatum]
MDSARIPKTPSRRPGERIFKTTKTCSIPSLTHLRKELGYGTRGEERDIAFKRAIRTQIKTFVSSSDSTPAYKFTKWKNTAHQRGLLEVTKDFLEVQGKGFEFWPQRDVPDTTQPLQYWKDSAKIRSFMTKVFWRAAREYKRHKIAFTTLPLLSQSTDTSCRSEDNPGDTKHPLSDNTTHLRGNSAEDPIDLETMQSTTSAIGPSRDNDPFVGRSIRFDAFVPAEDSLDEPSSSEPFSSSLFAPDMLGCQPTDAADNHQAAPEARMHGDDPWEGQQTSKRPAEASSNDNNHQAKCPRNKAASSGQPTHPSNKGKKAKKNADDASTTRRSSDRRRKPRVNQDSATEEQMMAVFNSDNETGQRQQSKGKANGQVPQELSSHCRDPAAPRGSTGEQTSAQAAREAAARQAVEEAAVMETAVGVEEQPRVATGLSARAQGKQPALPTRQAAVVEAGPSRERDVVEESTPRTETSAPQVVHPNITNSSGGSGEQEQEQQDFSIVIGDQEQQALDSCELIHTTNMEDTVTWVTQRFPTSFFQMSLADMFREAGLDDSATLHLRFRSRAHDWAERLERNIDGEDDFCSLKEQWLDHIAKQHRRAASTSMAQRRRAKYSLYFSNEPFTV